MTSGRNINGLRRQVFEFGKHNSPIINRLLDRDVFFGYTDEAAGPYATMLYADRVIRSRCNIAKVKLTGHGLGLSDYLSGVGLRDTDVVIVSPTHMGNELSSLRAQTSALRDLGVGKVLYLDVVGHGLVNVDMTVDAEKASSLAES